jgi:hypothetical protein
MCFSSSSGKKVEATFTGGAITSNAGVLLLKEIDQQYNITKQLAALLPDQRDQHKVEHPMLSMVRQRIYAIACGDEDVNDHNLLRHDLAMQTAVNSDTVLASASTMSRMENSFTRDACFEASKLMFEIFIQKHELKPPKEVILDFDATEDTVYGEQENRYYNGFYESHCFLPLYVFCGDDLLVSYLRPSNIDGAKHAWAILSLLVKRLGQVWPNTNIIFRGDCGFCRDAMLLWCERHGVQFIVGMPKNKRLERAIEKDVARAKELFEQTGKIQRIHTRFEYAAKSWKVKRTMVARIEYNKHGASVRFIATNVNGYSKRLYDKLYCPRGDMENKIKQQKLDLFSDRTSCHLFVSNQMRLIFSSFAYILIQALQDKVLKGTEIAKAYAGTVRNHLFKIGAVITRNTRRVRVMMSSAYPRQELFQKVVRKLVPI